MALLLVSFLGIPFIFAVLGSQTPDLIDKPLSILGLAPCPRYIGHTLLAAFLGSSALQLALGNYKKTLSFAVGYLSHFLGDAYGFLPLLFPFSQYQFPLVAFSIKYTLAFLLTDLLGIAVILYLYNRNSAFRKEVNGILSGTRDRLAHLFPHFL